MFFGKIKEEPRMNFGDIFAAMFVAIGLLMFLIALHVLAINSEGNTQEVLNTAFIIALRIYMTLIVIAFVTIIIHFLKYMVWEISTPKWLKNKVRNEK